MSDILQEIDKYIFDPQNPKQCKSYKLLLNIAKKDEHFAYIDTPFMEAGCLPFIVNQKFEDALWDRPDNYDDLSKYEKIDLYKKQLSQKDFEKHCQNIDINIDKIIYNKIFKNFFYFSYLTALSVKSEIYEINTENIIKKILSKNLCYFKQILSESYFNIADLSVIHGSKVLFTNEPNFLTQSSDFYDVASVMITTDIDMFKNTKNINPLIKPIFLKNMQDLELLLNVLYNDIQQVQYKDLPQETIATIDNINIKNYFGIKDITISNISDKKEIYIVGENGDGKTLLLQAIAVGIKGTSEGDVVNATKGLKEHTADIINKDKNKIQKDYKNFFAYGATRNSNCNNKYDEVGYLSLFNSQSDTKDPIEWLKYLDHKDKENTQNIITLTKAKELFKQLLNSDIDVSVSADGVKFFEKGFETPFEILSSGYKSVIKILVDLLYRLSQNQPYVSDIHQFCGIVLIDEVELHLHPKWEYDIVSTLREVFPNIQFILTTHSPTVLMGASKDAVFYKIYKEDGEINISNQLQNEGYTLNTLISSPIFDLGTATSRDYTGQISSDDFVMAKTHKAIAEKIKDIDISDEEIDKLIAEQLDSI